MQARVGEQAPIGGDADGEAGLHQQTALGGWVECLAHYKAEHCGGGAELPSGLRQACAAAAAAASTADMEPKVATSLASVRLLRDARDVESIPPPQLAAPSSLPFEMLTPTPPAHSPTTPPTNTALTPPAPAQAARVGEPNAAAAALRAYAEGKAELDGLRKELNVFRQVRTPTPCFPPPPGLHLVTIAAFHHPPACT